MTRGTKTAGKRITLLALAVLMSACTKSNTPPAAPAASLIPERTHEENGALGLQYKTAADLYQALREQAKGGQKLTPNSLPDWTGIYTRPLINGFTFDPDQPQGGLPTAKLTPEYQKKMMKRIEDVKHGIEWDPISTCSPPGMPRWLTEPFLREFIVTPDQTLLINEMVNDVRRVYTDGRDHIPEADRIPIPDGDSIGFWDGNKLVIHTNLLQPGIYQRSNPDYTDQVETVEIWQKKDDKTMGVDVWIFDPPALVEPWYVRQNYLKLNDEDKALRIRYWNCGENPNNSVFQTQDGTTQFKDLNFDAKDKQQKGKP